MAPRKSNARRQPGAAAQQGSRGAHFNSAHAQRQRLLQALRCGPVTTLQARAELDILNPACRVLELRRQGHEIATVRVHEATDAGRLHNVAQYLLLQKVRP